MRNTFQARIKKKQGGGERGEKVKTDKNSMGQQTRLYISARRSSVTLHHPDNYFCESFENFPPLETRKNSYIGLPFNIFSLTLPVKSCAPRLLIIPFIFFLLFIERILIFI